MYDCVVIGGGPAGLAAACEAYERGLSKILIIERDKELGGILGQCIHNGFGLHYFKEELTGPEYAERFIEMLNSTGVEVAADTMVLKIGGNTVHAVSKKDGYRIIETKTIILAMGCRERTRGAISVPGSRPSGIFTAGAAQRYVNIEGYMVGKKVVILGSGDIGLIMARRMTLEGAEVLACIEILPYPGGLNRNIVQCLNDYNIPLYLSHTIIDIIGSKRVERVIAAKVDEKRNPVPGTEIEFECDTLLLSVGLIPENELSRGAGIEIDSRTGGPVVYENMETSVQGVFACGNAVHVHDLVDFVTVESQRAGAAAAGFVDGQGGDSKAASDKKSGDAGQEADHSINSQRAETGGELRSLNVINGNGITYTVPQKIRADNIKKTVDIFFRVNKIYKKINIIAESTGVKIAKYKREHAAPGEMEKISLPKKLLEKAENELIIKVEVV